MLKFMRRHATGWMIKIMFSLIIVVFVLWGVGSSREREKIVAEVGPYKVGVSEYSEAYRKLLERYRILYGDRFDENVLKSLKLKETAMEQIVDKYLFLLKAKELGVGVSDREFAEHVESIAAFRRNGRFDQKVYEEILKREGIDPKRFEKNERQSLTVGKLMMILQDTGFSVNDEQMEKAYMSERGLVKLGYLVFQPADFEKDVAVSEKEVSEAYEKEKSLHRTENLYHLRYITIDGKGKVKDDQAYMELLKSHDIQAYAKANGLDVTDLGVMKESEILKRLERFKPAEWLKGMNKGDVSLPIRVEDKSFIFQVVGAEEGKPLDRQEAFRVIRARMVSERAKVMAKTKAESVVADKSIRFVKDTGFIPRSSTSIPSIGQIPQEHTGLFALSAAKRVYDKPVEIGGKYYVFGFEDEKAPDRSQFEREKQAYRQYYLAKARADFLASLREEMKKETKVKVDLESL